MMFNPASPTPGDGLSAAELDLYNLIMDYRAQRGLPAIPLSTALTTTAGRHAQDTVYNVIEPNGGTLPAGFNLHSWSDAPYDASMPGTMWDAPARIGVSYPSQGFEISAWGQSSNADALTSWQNSPGHDSVITNTGPWANLAWQSIGIGIEHDPNVGPNGTHVYHVWFGASADPAGPPALPGQPPQPPAPGTGTPGDDVFMATAGPDVFDGGDGFDTVTVPESLYTADFSQDSFANVEAFVFTDAEVRFDFDGNAGTVYRLYRAAYDRTPDVPGLSFWVEHRDNGLTIEQIADAFVMGPEFNSIYGGLTDEQVVGGFYQNIFGRPADGPGFTFWTDVLSRPEIDTSDLLLYFSESPEGKALVLPEISGGILLDV